MIFVRWHYRDGIYVRSHYRRHARTPDATQATLLPRFRPATSPPQPAADDAAMPTAYVNLPGQLRMFERRDGAAGRSAHPLPASTAL